MESLQISGILSNFLKNLLPFFPDFWYIPNTPLSRGVGTCG
jgi:hypothetical protein